MKTLLVKTWVWVKAKLHALKASVKRVLDKIFAD